MVHLSYNLTWPPIYKKVFCRFLVIQYIAKSLLHVFGYTIYSKNPFAGFLVIQYITKNILQVFGYTIYRKKSSTGFWLYV
jgi:hypothetical protein